MTTQFIASEPLPVDDAATEPLRSLRAVAQHEAFVALLRRAGARVDLLPGLRTSPASVFTKEDALLYRDHRNARALLPRPRYGPQGHGALVRRAHLVGRGFELVIADQDLACRDVMAVGEGFLVGYGYRSSEGAADLVRAFSGRRALALQLVDRHLDHLDVAVAALDDGTVLACPEALAPGSLALLQRCSFIRSVVLVPRRDALAYGLGFVQVGRRALLGGHASCIERVLAARGLAPIVTPLDAFHLAGGSAACLVARIHGPTEQHREESPATARFHPVEAQRFAPSDNR